MSEINVELEKGTAKMLLPKQQAIGWIKNGQKGFTEKEFVEQFLDHVDQVGFCAMGEANRIGHSLWVVYKGTYCFFETDQDKVSELALSMGIELLH
jgi:hypothetical protein